MKTFIYLIILSLNFLFAQSGLVINEFVASNINTYRDEYKNYNDWIELFNGSGSTIDIGGMYLSDDALEINKWQIPTGSDLTTIEADSFLILWADSDPLAGVLHLDFKLSSSGEQILLAADDGISIIDSLSFPQQTANYSYGRSSADPSVFKFFINPTPVATNENGYIGVVSAPLIASPSGNYLGNFEVTVTNSDPESEIYYTTDGSTPKISSMPYTVPVSIENSSVFSVRAYKDGFIPSKTVSKAYFINENFNLPVLSIITDPLNLFSDSIGIYSNYTKGGALWERPISGHYFRNDSSHSFSGGIRIQGRTSRTLPKKSFRLFFKTGYGQERLEYDMFGLPNVKSFKNLVTRPGYDDDISPSNALGTLLRDPIVSEGWQKVGGLTSVGNWAIMYINNDYWGIYNIRESINDFFISDHLGYENFDLIRYDKSGPLLQAGSIDDWNLMWNLVENEDLSLPENYETLKSYIDLDNLLSFQAMIQCTQYRSWGWGAYAYKEKSAASKWRWAPWDMDRAYTDQDWPGISIYQTTSAELWGNLMIKKLLLNEDFKTLFINRVADFLNAYHTPDNINALIDSLAGIIEAEIPAEADRWDSSLSKWNTNVNLLHDFANNRPDIVFQQMQDNFGLSDPNQLTFEIAEGEGYLKVNSLTINETNWNGRYFPENEIQISVAANPGYRFIGWTDESLANEPDISLSLTEDLIIEPVFEQVPTSNYFEIIAPSLTKTSEKLPIIVRSRKPSKEINRYTAGEFSITNTSSLEDSTFKLKKGSGTLLSKVNAPSNFSLQMKHLDYETEQKTIIVNNSILEEHHSGELVGDITWTDSADHIIDDDINIPEGTTLKIEAGSRILLLEHVNMIVNGTLQIEGTKDDPVFFTSFDSSYSWGGLEFYNSVSNVEYCFFVNGGGDPSKGWAHTNTQPVLFSRSLSDLTLENVFILNSPGKAVGATQSIFNMNESIIANIWHGGEFSYSRIHINNSYIMNIPNDDGQHIAANGDDDNDGFHLDNNYSAGGKSIIENSFFIDGKDDGIDQNRKNLIIKNCWIEGWLNEGVATSGGDTVKIFNTITTNCTSGFEAGHGNPQMVIDHSIAFNNILGFRFGDSYSSPNTGHMKVTNSISFDNRFNIRNYTKALSGPYPGGIDITYSMTNDSVYNDSLGNISGVPQFDEDYYLLPTSAGASAGINGTNMGLVDELPPIASLIIINEIMYKPVDAHDTGDWIEIYNPSNQAKNLSGWILKDQDEITPFSLPQGTIINAKGYLVICEDTTLFKSEHHTVKNIIGNFEFGFSRDFDKARLFAPNEFIVDSVEYSSTGSWPSSPNGTGPSLELIEPLLDNNISDAWDASQYTGGTPGIKNSILTNIEPKEAQTPQVFKLYQNYPNPFNPQTTIKYDLEKASDVTLTVFDISGREITKIVREHQNPGSNYFIFNASEFASGIYIYQIKAGRFISQKKMLFIK